MPAGLPFVFLCFFWAEFRVAASANRQMRRDCNRDFMLSQGLKAVFQEYLLLKDRSCLSKGHRYRLISLQNAKFVWYIPNELEYANID